MISKSFDILDKSIVFLYLQDIINNKICLSVNFLTITIYPQFFTVLKKGFYQQYRKFHYIFLQNQSNPGTDPVVLQLGGGPRCTSLLGLNEEIGPFVMVDDDRVFKKNPYSWNNRLNLLFIDQPARVGFSTNNDPNYKYNDINSGEDNYQAILVWFSIFKQYQKNRFFIVGESYAEISQKILRNSIIKYKLFNIFFFFSL
ncbi:unnamed protein product [Paramecium sonneborni]|uniref:Uncharacterized protein n=1 Tax=Paramecium sonneborni TaxID=65129 RepID=A0A8S1Q2I7_9CILI|nr:unnamed protein product [Paramecium sonneborni]